MNRPPEQPGPENATNRYGISDQITVNSGETVTVGVYKFLESAKAEMIAADCGLLDRLRELFTAPANPGDDDGLIDIKRALYLDLDALLELLSLSIGKPKEWIASLDHTDGQLLLLSWWTLNADLFIHAIAAEGALVPPSNKVQVQGPRA